MTFIPEDREGIETTPDLLLSIDDNRSAYITSAVLTARRGAPPGGRLPLPVPGGRGPRRRRAAVVRVPGDRGSDPVRDLERSPTRSRPIDIADEFASGTPIRGEAGDDRADDLSDMSGAVDRAPDRRDGRPGVPVRDVAAARAPRGPAHPVHGGPRSDRRSAGRVFQLAGISTIVQAFWLGALGALFLGRWPGGRGPAWETGEAEPWPTAAAARAASGDGTPEPAQELDPSAPPPEPEPVPERPASRKRRKKRR